MAEFSVKVIAISGNLTEAQLDQVRANCTNPTCSRRGDECVGYHCSVCSRPCNMMGHHDCVGPPVQIDREAAEAIADFIDAHSWERLPAKMWTQLRDVIGPQIRKALDG